MSIQCLKRMAHETRQTNLELQTQGNNSELTFECVGNLYNLVVSSVSGNNTTLRTAWHGQAQCKQIASVNLESNDSIMNSPVGLP